MATEFKLPDLGEGVEDADVLRVLVSEGQDVTLEQSVIEIETEKATVEVPSSVAGKVTRVLVHEGDTIKPGQLILLVDAVGAAPPPAAPGGAPPAAEPAAAAATPPPAAPPTATAAAPSPPPPAEPAATPAPPPAEGAPSAQPTAPPPAAEAAAARPATQPAPPPPPPPPGDRPVFAAPSLRKFAREIGVDLADVIGTGPGGRISEDDVKRQSRALRAAPAAPAPDSQARPAAGAVVPPPPLPDFSQWGEIEREPLTRLRRTVARNMATSWSHIPHVTLQHWADITAIEEMRQQYKERARQAGGNLTISVVMLKIAAAALRAHPKFNASLDLDANELILKRYYHIGVAVDTDRGLVVPVIRDVDQKNIIELSVELAAISERARKNELGLEEMRGASFTVTNLGSLGTGFFSPIINHPEVAVLGLGRAERRQVWQDGAWVPRLLMPLSVVFDHRVIDGADGARFASWLVDAVDNPLLLALEG